jgi:RimJ/RimL family protein N-acetyltransferase
MNAELGYWIGQPFWGKGIMTTVIQKMVKYSFENFDITRIFARPYGSNIGSQKALEKAGFKLEAKFEKILIKNNVFEDELVYAIRKV